jgi:hypothetical protein
MNCDWNVRGEAESYSRRDVEVKRFMDVGASTLGFVSGLLLCCFSAASAPRRSLRFMLVLSLKAVLQSFN